MKERKKERKKERRIEESQKYGRMRCKRKERKMEGCERKERKLEG